MITALVVVAIGIAAFLYFDRKPQAPAAAPEAPKVASATPAPAEVAPSTPAPVEAAPVASEPAPVAEEKPLDWETVARTPALQPKTVLLTRSMTVPITIDGKPSGVAQLPEHTSVRVLRISAGQLEVEYLDQRISIPGADTDLLARATELSHAPAAAQAGAPAPAPAAAANATVTVAPIASAPAATPRPFFSTASPAAPGRYQQEAAEVMEDIQKKFWMRQSKRYAKKAESHDPDLVWGAGVMFTAVVGATRRDSNHYRPVLQEFFEGLNGYWDAKASIPGYEPAPTSGNGHDKYYDDNAWLAITFFEAYELTHNPAFRRRADETLDFVLSGWDETLGGGIWWHESHEKKSGKNTCSNAPAAVGCLLSAKYASPTVAKQRLDMAEKIVKWTNSNLQNDNGLFGDSISVDGKVNHGALTYNSALMLRANLGLFKATKQPTYLREAQKIGRAADSFSNKDTGVYRDHVKWAHLMVEADLELYRTTHESYLLARATRNANAYYETWKNNPPDDLISMGGIARTLWLMADLEADKAGGTMESAKM